MVRIKKCRWGCPGCWRWWDGSMYVVAADPTSGERELSRTGIPTKLVTGGDDMLGTVCLAPQPNQWLWSPCPPEPALGPPVWLAYISLL